MCGICGQLTLNNSKINENNLSLMMEKIASRGPDSSGKFIDKNIALGHQRLSIIDLSNYANQPMKDKALGLVLVFNGAIYNYQILRKNLISKGYSFFSSSDTEVIIKAYDFWGEDCVNHLDGMFAFCIWDSNKNKLFVARDRMGIKPIYFSLTNKNFSFASNTKALIAIGADVSIDKNSLQQQLSLHGVVPAPNTILKGIKKIKPASFITIDAKGVISETIYWKPKAKRNTLNNAENIEKTNELLTKAILNYTKTSDVPVGVLLSGGLDSSLLVGLLSKSGYKNINTFSIGFDDIGDEYGSEFKYSDQVVDKFNTTHKKYIIDNKEVLSRLVEAVKNMSEPMVGQDAIAFYLLSQRVVNDVKVVLSGQGADEVFAGYFWYEKMQSEIGSDYERFSKHYVDRSYSKYLQTINKNYHSSNTTKTWIEQEFMASDSDEFIDRVLHLDITNLIVDDPVKRVDNMTMAWGLEARVPFMDHKLVEHALSMPYSLKKNKYPLKKIAKGLLPDDIINREKGYFPMPALKYIKGDFLDFMADILNSSICKNRGIFNQKFIQKIIDNPNNYMTKLNGSSLWHLALLEYWLQINT